MEPSTVKPRLKVVGLHVENFRALRRVDWPEDGIGWNGQVPDVVMVGGVNGSGKTTLLELIADAARMLRGDGPVMWSSSDTVNAWIDFQIQSQSSGDFSFRVLLGNKPFTQQYRTEECLRFVRTKTTFDPIEDGSARLIAHKLVTNPITYEPSDFPGIIYFPTERRFNIPDVPFKPIGDIETPHEFFFKFKSAKNWGESLGALLHAARWADLNAKEEGTPEKANHFESYSKAFQLFFGDTKHLVWEGGKLFVKIDTTNERHQLMDLSSGEKQALIFAAELYRRWRPGSLILIDEPELHFHPSWQTTLWTMLEQMQKERGGQVIVATQSTHLFLIAEPATKVLLGGPLG